MICQLELYNQCVMIIHLIYSGQLFLSKSQRVQIAPPQLPRHRKVPVKLEIGSSASEQVDCVKDLFRRQYVEAVDLVVNCIRARFDQPDYQIYKNVESLLLNAAKDDFDIKMILIQVYCALNLNL